MTKFSQADSMHRLVKQLLDSGSASSLEEAEALFAGYRVQLIIGDSEVASQHSQAALLTAVVLARRVFLGGVDVAGNMAVRLLAPLVGATMLDEAVRLLGGRISREVDRTVPLIRIGGASCPRESKFDVRVVFGGWRGGVVPSHIEFENEEAINPLATMLAAAFAVSEAFFHVQGTTPTAGRRTVGLSLWDITRLDWLCADRDHPRLQYIPSNLWLIGLGHLGQAYLWALGLLPYSASSEASLVLQDMDVITPSSFSTSVLSEPAMCGRKKTRQMAAWAEERGFRTTICERKFDLNSRRDDEEPMVALCGLDNALGRQALDRAGFSLVVEAGLGRGFRDFRTLRLHTLPSSRPSSEIWNKNSQPEDLSNRPAYQKMMGDGALDTCGATLLAGKAVGAPFVGAVAACLAISEVLRLLHGGVLHELIDLDLQSPEHRYLVAQRHDFSSLNPGYVAV